MQRIMNLKKKADQKDIQLQEAGSLIELEAGFFLYTFQDKYSMIMYK